MSNLFGGYNFEDASEIHRRVLGRQSAQPPADIARLNTVHNPLYYVVLTGDLDKADDYLTGYTQAEATILRYVQPMETTLNMEESDAPDGVVTVTNRYTSFSARTGDLLLVVRNGSEWSPVTSLGIFRHATIHECLGEGFYRGRFGDAGIWVLPEDDRDCAQCPNTGTGTGTFGEDGLECRSNRTTVIQNGDDPEIYIYDPRRLDLTIGDGSHVIITDMGTRLFLYDTGTGSPGVGNDDTVLWMVLTGAYQKVSIPDRFYDCCDGVVTLIRTDTYCVEGTYCMGDETPCDVLTGTGGEA